MRLKVGAKTPDFAGATASGERVTLDSLRGRNVVLKFYRFASCPVCNLSVRDYVRRSDDLSRAGLTTVMFYHSPARLIEKKLRTKTPFAVVADPAKDVFREYAVESSWRGMSSLRMWRQYMRAMFAGFMTRPFGHQGGMIGYPADFLIDKDGVVRYAHYGADYSDSLTADDCLRIAGE